jgi:hypothetical protein
VIRVTAAVALAVLALASSANAALWLDLDRAVSKPGQTVHATAVKPCSLCGARALYLVDAKRYGGLRSLRKLPTKSDRRFIFVGRFSWKLGGTFTFTVPKVRPGVYQLHAIYRNGTTWTAAPASTIVRIQA